MAQAGSIRDPLCTCSSLFLQLTEIKYNIDVGKFGKVCTVL